MPSLKQAQVSISAKIEKHDNVIGYLIDGIAVIVDGLQMVAGGEILLSSIASGNIVGTIVGLI